MLKSIFGWSAMFALLVLAIVVSETVPLVKDLESLIKQHEFWLLVGTGGMAVLGFVLFMGGGLDMLMTQGEPMSHEEVEDLDRSNRDLAAQPYTWRASTSRIWGKTSGGEVYDEFSFRSMKDAWRTGAWWRSSQWRQRLVITAGGLLMIFGGFGLAFVLAPASIKLLVGGAMLYALARLTWGFWRA
jgi:hypothetical protein